MKHLLNNLGEEEKNSIREQHSGGMKVNTEKFGKLVEAKQGDVKVVNESPLDYLMQGRSMPNENEKQLVKGLKSEIEEVFDFGGNPMLGMRSPESKLRRVISRVREICDKYDSLVESKSDTDELISEERSEVDKEIILSLILKYAAYFEKENFEDAYDWMENVVGTVEDELMKMGVDQEIVDSLREDYDDLLLAYWEA